MIGGPFSLLADYSWFDGHRTPAGVAGILDLADRLHQLMAAVRVSRNYLVA
jgi:hypothetical protein